MTTLDFPGQPPRVTDDAQIIATLTRKGWTVRADPPHASGCQWDGAQWVVTPDEAIRAEIVARIKQLAGDHILANMPMWRQSNFHGRNAELSLIKESRPLTEEELAERAAMLAVWTWAKSVRAASDAAEAALAGMTRAELDNWTEPQWPVFGA